MSRPVAGAPWLLAPAVLVADFATKRLVLSHADRLSHTVSLVGDYARLALVRNPGAAMGLPLGGRLLLITVSLVAAVVLVLLYRRTPPDARVRRGALAAILGGALGNLVDRVFYNGLVVDFIDLGWGTHRFYTFNVADMGVTLGGLALFVSLWRESPRTQTPPDTEPADAEGPADVADGPATSPARETHEVPAPHSRDE